MTSFLENLKPQQRHDQLLISIELSKQFNPHLLRPYLIRNPAVTFDF